MNLRSNAITLAAGLLHVLLPIGEANAQAVKQIDIAAVSRMAPVPKPLDVRPWTSVSRDYYSAVFDLHRKGEGFPAVQVDKKAGYFRMKSYLGSKPDTEAFTCLAAVAGAKLSGLDPEHLYGADYLALTMPWYDPQIGIYRHRANERGGEIHADIYGYWPAILGLVLADLYPDNARLQKEALTSFDAFLKIAKGLGAPDKPDFGGLGWNFASNKPGGREEPMNRLGHAPSVAWVLMAGATRTGDRGMLEYSRAAMQWHIDHPGRYEMTQAMGPLTAARLNTTGVPPLDMRQVLDSWFGDGPADKNPWFVTSGTEVGGITCDGLDAARVGDDFYAFSMGTLQNPAWLVPVARYDPRYAAAIGRYALHAANSSRLLQGTGLPAAHHDHAEWKAEWDKENLFFYEGLRTWDPTPERTIRPYATGDPVLNGWTGKPKAAPEEYHREKKEWFGRKPYNIALYMGNHVGFLGGIVESTDVPGILSWDCVKTDWFHPPAFPTRLVFNPHRSKRSFHVNLGNEKVHVYDLVSRSYLARTVSGATSLSLGADTAAVLVLIPVNSDKPRKEGNRFISGNTVIDWTAPGPR